jgi:TonB family protein
MPLRCLLFSSNEEMVQPIWQVLTDLGIEGEYCRSAVDAVERVTTQLFQIVITDWEDQPEAAFLLKTARDLKAAQRPLILAIVGDDAKLPEALRAGANSVLVKPIRAEQVRDTMSTACELLRSKLQPGAPKLAAQLPTAAAVPLPAAPPETSKTGLAAAAGAGAVSVPVSVPTSVPASVTQAPEKAFRAGEFLTSANASPGAQFDTEPECDVQKSLDEAAAAEVDSLTDLEPTAAAVQEAAEPTEAQTPLTGWAALQARLTKPILQPAKDAPPKSELLSYGETPSYKAPLAELPATDKDPVEKETPEESGQEAALFDYMSGKPGERAEQAETPGSKRGKILLVSAFAVACVVLVAVPRTKLTLRMFYRNAVHAGGNWLNPPPAPLPQAVAQHDSFGQSGDEYKLPAPGNIPDATTDPSQIRVLPVIDPTAKTEKGSDANGGRAQATTGESTATDQKPTDQDHPDQNQAGQGRSGQAQAGNDQIKDPSATSIGAVPGSTAGTLPGEALPSVPVQPNPPAVQTAAPQPHLVTSSVQSVAPPHAVSTGSSTGIPSSLKSQMASTTPDASGNKPVEAAMSAIEPVNLPESAARELLAQPVEPEYPAAAKASGQRGSVVLQVLVGRDGAVQDVKFLQGSLMFARAAIDAVRQWHFKPYVMNGRAVSVQTMITLNFTPPA